MSLVVGLTGGIGSGKSTVANILERLGVCIVDTDVISRRLTQAGGSAIAALRKAFGNEYFTPSGELDRSRMRSRIFSDPSAKHLLESILHPLILELARQEINGQQNCPYIVIVVPLLPESPAFRQLVQRVLVIDCTEERQVDRVKRRSAMTEIEARTIIAQQTPRSERLELADDVIHNDGSLDDLASQTNILHDRYMVLANAI